jgi:hypothetical protein
LIQSLKLRLVHLVLILNWWYKRLCSTILSLFFCFWNFTFFLLLNIINFGGLCQLSSYLSFLLRLIILTFLNHKLDWKLCLISRKLNIVEVHLCTKCIKKISKSDMRNTRLIFYLELSYCAINLKDLYKKWIVCKKALTFCISLKSSCNFLELCTILPLSSLIGSGIPLTSSVTFSNGKPYYSMNKLMKKLTFYWS